MGSIPRCHPTAGNRELGRAAERVHLVMGVASRRRTEMVDRRPERFRRQLALHPAATSATALGINDVLQHHRAQTAKALPPGVPPCVSSSEAWGSGFVEGAVSEHGEQDADAVPGQAKEGLGVGLPAASAFVVVGAGGGVVQGGE
ncbi:hypothetical protein GCM10027168_47350 [Streptomyces capparidis]